MLTVMLFKIFLFYLEKQQFPLKKHVKQMTASILKKISRHTVELNAKFNQTDGTIRNNVYILDGPLFQRKT